MKLQKTKDFLKANIVTDESIEVDATLHHFGLYSKGSHQLEQAVWVSDRYECAKDYKNHAAAMNQPIYYSTFEPRRTLRLANLNGVSLLQACEGVGICDHGEWNRALAAALTEMGYDGLVYCDREIHISKPAETLRSVSSSVCVR